MKHGIQPPSPLLVKGTLSHRFRKMVTDWWGRNMEYAENHELVRLHTRLTPVAHTLGPHFDARNLYRRVSQELERRA